ncbi:MAG: DNA polymerase IV [Alphaproteobacteria bacterium]
MCYPPPRPTLCRDCLTLPDPAPGPRCPACARPRLVHHAELTALAIAHMDCDAFYASVEKRDEPALADRPVIVGGGRRGVVATCCYIARIAGVRSAMPMFKALKLCPDAVVLPPRMEVYVAVSRQIREAMLALTPLVEPLSLDEAFLDLTGTGRLLGAPPAVAMARLAQTIEREIGITVSVGLSHNKYLAKVASDLDKPRGFSVIGEAETLDFLAPRPVRSIWGVGAALARRLEADGIHLIADLRPLGAERLVARYGRIGQRLHELSHGIDPRRVDPDQPTRSISTETTFEADIADRDQLIGHLWRLAVKTSDRAKAKGLAGGTVTLKLKCADFRALTRQDRLASPTSLAETIYRHGEAMLAGLLERAPFRLIGIGISDLEQADGGAAPPGDLFEGDQTARSDAEAATDEIRARFGKDAIIRGRALR